MSYFRPSTNSLPKWYSSFSRIKEPSRKWPPNTILTQRCSRSGNGCFWIYEFCIYHIPTCSLPNLLLSYDPRRILNLYLCICSPFRNSTRFGMVTLCIFDSVSKMESQFALGAMMDDCGTEHQCGFHDRKPHVFPYLRTSGVHALLLSETLYVSIGTFSSLFLPTRLSAVSIS